MVRTALLRCLPLAVLAAACGGRVTVARPEPTACQASMPEATAWDGTPAAPGSVIVVEPAPPGQDAPDQDATLVAYEIDPQARLVRRVIRGKAEQILQLAAQPFTDPRDNASTISIIRKPPPPPPPPIFDPLRELVGLAVRVSNPAKLEPCQKF